LLDGDVEPRGWIRNWPAYRQLTGRDQLGRGAAVRSPHAEAAAPRTASAERVAASVCPYRAVGSKIVAPPGAARSAHQASATAVSKITTSGDPWRAAGGAGVLFAAGCSPAALMRGHRLADGSRGAAGRARRHEIIGDHASDRREHHQRHDAPAWPAALPEREVSGRPGHVGSGAGLWRALSAATGVGRA
jgi:hypothetical protein